MPEHEHIIEVVRGWVEKAENDLRTAVHILKMEQRCPTDTVCFHAQQCVEKYIKAVLVLDGTDFPRTHDIEQLVSFLPRGILDTWALREQRTLTQYATTTRYPGDYEPIAMAEAKRAVKIARRVRKDIRAALPREALSAVR